jgi:hypothetical protein
MNLHLKNTEEKQIDNTFCMHNRNSKQNILFLGSCRLVPLIHYYSKINISTNIYHLYTPFWNHEKRATLPIETINQILKNTEFIITETINNYGILNTNDSNDFFKTFETKNLNQIKIPNLNLKLYLWDIISFSNKDKIKEVREQSSIPEYYDLTFKESLERLRLACENSGFIILYEFIIEHLTETRMFYTFLHPSKTLSMLTFKILMQKIGEVDSISADFFRSMKQYDFLEDWCSPITKMDVEYHNLKFPIKVFDDSIIDSKKFSQPDSQELEVSDKSLDLINSY